MKIVTILFGLFISLNTLALNEPEATWESRIRSFLTKIVGEKLSNKIVGQPQIVELKIELPMIPTDFKKITNTETYVKKSRGQTEFDRLLPEKKRQFNYKFIQELFLVTRKVEARDEDLANWMNILDQGGSREGIYQALVLDEIYSGLEDVNEAPSNKLIDFLLKYSNIFLNKRLNPDSLKKLNLYSLKRIFTDNILDLLEYYEIKDLDSLDRWYAVFSGHIAHDYGPLMKSQIRQEESSAYHYEWAKKMPVQHIKSEVIIKIHSVMNSLQLLN